ncbi:hypothetical protein PsorP6_006979 [Peronosclerospora sorghi]|uniref:Uncharacterized protein n=1 Tax=Peronosclerospora sorghi TaxID=230839 RepID=A0ACC0WA30_9STRA|nr:hypothetical protein PsorP6_006979 [Peronosclerospora sorghi]
MSKRHVPRTSKTARPKPRKALLVGPVSPSRSGPRSSRTQQGGGGVPPSSTITLDMLRPYFEVPLAKVAASLGICVTLLKKICRRHGIARWPHRQITGLRKSVASMEHAIRYFDGPRRDVYAQQLVKQKHKLAALLADPTTNNPLLADEPHRDRWTPTVGQGARFPMDAAAVPRTPLLGQAPRHHATSRSAPAAAWWPTASRGPRWDQVAHQAARPRGVLPPISSLVLYTTKNTSVHVASSCELSHPVGPHVDEEKRF